MLLSKWQTFFPGCPLSRKLLAGLAGIGGWAIMMWKDLSVKHIISNQFQQGIIRWNYLRAPPFEQFLWAFLSCLATWALKKIDNQSIQCTKIEQVINFHPMASISQIKGQLWGSTMWKFRRYKIHKQTDQNSSIGYWTWGNSTIHAKNVCNIALGRFSLRIGEALLFSCITIFIFITERFRGWGGCENIRIRLQGDM